MKRMKTSLMDQTKASYWRRQLEQITFQKYAACYDHQVEWDHFSSSLDYDLCEKAAILTKHMYMAKVIFVLTGFITYFSLYSEDSVFVVMTSPQVLHLTYDDPYIPIIINVKRSMTVHDMMNAVKIKVMEAVRFSPFDISIAIEEMQIDKEINKNLWLYSVHQKADNPHMAQSHLNFIIEADDYKYRCYCDRHYYSKTEQHQIMYGLMQTYRFILENPNVSLSELNYMSQDYEELLLNRFGSNELDIGDSPLTITEMYMKRIKESADDLAVTDYSGSITYAQLHDRVVSIICLLAEQGVKNGDKIAVVMEKSIDLVAAMFASILMGVVYIPIHYADPVRRINSIIKTGDIKYILTNMYFQMQINKYDVPLLDAGSGKIPNPVNCKQVNDIIHEALPDDIVYIIFTSGSTGKPKGVQISHRNLAYMVYGFYDLYFKHYDDSNQINIAVVAPHIFDVSVQQIFPCLLSGHKLFLLSDDEKKDYEKMALFFERNRIHITDFTPTLFHNFITSGIFTKHQYSFRDIILAGEKLYRSVIDDFLALHISETTITNAYGPTECTVTASAYSITGLSTVHTDSIPIGKPNPNTKLYVLNKDLSLQFIGVPGELYIGGTGVSYGYVNDPLRTSECFINNPFCPNEMMYKTGDIVRWLEDGNLLFLRRNNSQIKLRGFRIETDEIENIMLSKKGIKNVSVRLRNTVNNAYLAAYYTTANNSQDDGLKSFLEQYLPYYMIPTFFVYMDKFPLTANGKINYNMLPDPIDLIEKKEYLYHSEQELEIVELLKEVLNIKRINYVLGFFDHGGNSISAVNLLSKINQTYNTDIKLVDLYESSTVSAISSLIDRNKKSISQTQNMDISDDQDVYQSPQQQRIYISELLNSKSTENNILEVYEISGPFQVKCAVQAFQDLYSRHESLRTTFYHIGDQLFQKVHYNAVIAVKVHDKCDAEVFDDETLDKVLQKINIPFSLDKGPLIDVNIYKFSNNRFLLILKIHHIVFDATSMDILIRDFFAFYDNVRLPNLTTGYRAYSKLQHDFLRSSEYTDMKNFWLKRLQRKMAPLRLPFDYSYPDIVSFEGDAILEYIHKSELSYLSNLFKQEKLNHFLFMFSCYINLLYQLTKQKNIIVGMVMSDRSDYNFKDVVGLFVNIIPVLVELDTDFTPKRIRLTSREAVILSMQNMKYPYLDMINDLNLKRENKRPPIFDVSFNMVEHLPVVSHLQDQSIHFRQRIRKVHETVGNLHMQINDYGDDISIQLFYNRRLFKKDTVTNFLNHYISIIREVSEEEI